MRERATAAGGTIDIGPLPGGGFRVAARLPLGLPPLTTRGRRDHSDQRAGHGELTRPPGSDPMKALTR